MAKSKNHEETVEELYEEAQLSVVGSLLYGTKSNAVSDSDVAEVLDTVGPDDFDNPSCRILMESIASLVASSQTINTMTVMSSLEQSGNLKKFSPNEIQDIYRFGKKAIAQQPPVFYASVVKEYSVKYSMQDYLDEVLDNFVPDSGIPVSDAVAGLQSHLEGVSRSMSTSSTISSTIGMKERFVEKLHEREEITESNIHGASGLQGIPSLLPTLDEITSGWQGGQMITVGAQTGVGKSVFGIDCAVAAAQAGATVMLFSLEMALDEVENRIVAIHTGIPIKDLQQGKIHKDDEETLEKGLEDLSRMNLIIDVQPGLTVEALRSRIARQAQSKKGLDMVIIDYLQLLEVSKSARSYSREQDVANIANAAKEIAKTFNIPVMVLAQLRRPKDNDEEEAIPTEHWIRESGSIAQNSDIVLLLHRPRQEAGGITPNTKVIIAKHRNGESHRTITCHSDLECSVFREVERHKDDDDTNFSEDDILNDDEDGEESFTSFKAGATGSSNMDDLKDIL